MLNRNNADCAKKLDFDETKKQFSMDQANEFEMKPPNDIFSVLSAGKKSVRFED